METVTEVIQNKIKHAEAWMSSTNPVETISAALTSIRGELSSYLKTQGINIAEPFKDDMHEAIQKINEKITELSN